MIVSSFQTQYGIRIYSQVFREMKWSEFSALMGGLGPDTPLGRIVAIRSEDDKETLKHFSNEQHRIRNEYRSRYIAKVNMTEEQFEKEMKSLEAMFAALCS